MIDSRPERNSARLRQVLLRVYASATRSGSRVFHASSAMRTFCVAVSWVKGGKGGRAFWFVVISISLFVFWLSYIHINLFEGGCSA